MTACAQRLRLEPGIVSDVLDEVRYTQGPIGRPRSGFDYVIATDGACSGNPGPGGWAWLEQITGAYQCGGDASTTNNRMELIALIRALEFVPPEASLLVRADSSYVINSLTKWAKGWRARGWRKADGKPVLNRELIEALLNLYEARTGRTEIEWVKGHAGDAANEFVDRAAVRQSQAHMG
ncbi:MAG: ribonuclease HI [Actinomycetaceae bacterium]|nr:ribonuclease HI [Actinomycetaceae bacterium]MDY5854750.1 ribonuclease H [Arcanobacterium sp.]